MRERGLVAVVVADSSCAPLTSDHVIFSTIGVGGRSSLTRISSAVFSGTVAPSVYRVTNVWSGLQCASLISYLPGNGSGGLQNEAAGTIPKSRPDTSPEASRHSRGRRRACPGRRARSRTGCRADDRVGKWIAVVRERFAVPTEGADADDVRAGVNGGELV